MGKGRNSSQRFSENISERKLETVPSFSRGRDNPICKCTAVGIDQMSCLGRCIYVFIHSSVGRA